MLRIALRPRFLGLLALMVVATLVCGLLASWQWERAHRALSDQAAGSEQLGDVRGVLGVGDAVTNAIVGDTVTATGSFVPGEQVLVPGRHIEGTDAVLVVSALLVDLEDGTQARLPIARGWLPTEELTGADGQLDPSLAPAPPEGEVEVSGRLEASEAASSGITEGTTSEISTPLLVNEWGSPMYSGFVSLDEPAGSLRPLPAAESEFSRGLNWQNIGYSMQWVLFGAFFLYLWWRSVRSTHLDEVADRREAMERMLSEGSEGSEDPEGPEDPEDAGGPGEQRTPVMAAVAPARSAGGSPATDPSAAGGASAVGPAAHPADGPAAHPADGPAARRADGPAVGPSSTPAGRAATASPSDKDV